MVSPHDIFQLTTLQVSSTIYVYFPESLIPNWTKRRLLVLEFWRVFDYIYIHFIHIDKNRSI